MDSAAQRCPACGRLACGCTASPGVIFIPVPPTIQNADALRDLSPMGGGPNPWQEKPK